MKKDKLKNRPSFRAYVAFWREEIETRYRHIMKPVARYFADSGIDPDLMTVVGCFFNGLAGLVYAQGAFFWAAFVVLIAGLCDTLDGLIARLTHKQSAHGAFVDSIMDRYSDLFLFLGMAYFFMSDETLYGFFRHSRIQTGFWPMIWIILALSGSYLVSYTRARAEGLGLECKPGIMQRPERLVLLILGSWLSALPRAGLLIFEITLGLLAILTHLTALQQIVYIHKRLIARSK
ncbi:MAG: CDP-alcohol phosphatidyltransferase family protein [Desulfobacteraceae bacterium]|nr:MAG: CDP-alcohol phosphatidyltransferase family protein [Desulfobacteraceae bacterium]